MSEVAEVLSSAMADLGFEPAQVLDKCGLPYSDRGALRLGTLPAWKLRAICEFIGLPEAEVYNAKYADTVAGASERTRAWWDKPPSKTRAEPSPEEMDE